VNINLVLAVVFIALVVALFVLALIEASLLHLRRSEVAVEAVAGDRAAARLLQLLDDLPRVMNAVLLAVLLGQVTATTIAGVLARRWFGGTGITIATVTVTILLFVYGEAIPKTLAIRQPLKIARRLSGVTRWMSVILRPFVSVLVFVANKQSPAGTTDTVTAISEEELLHLADEAANAGRIEESDAELIERSFTIGDRHTGEIIVLRDDICAVPHDTPIDVALRIAIAAGHRRIPVFRGSLDHIVGFVRLRDLADPAAAEQHFEVAQLTQQPLTVRPEISVIDLLRSMQSSGVHMAVVVDADGHTMGIATIEDAVEELVGTIEDRRH
jgi:CBS domain containing-hemolysin-like protein